MRREIALVLAFLAAKVKMQTSDAASTIVESRGNYSNTATPLTSRNRRRGGGRGLLRKRLIYNDDVDDDARGNESFFVPPSRAGFSGSSMDGHLRNWRRAARRGSAMLTGGSQANNASDDRRTTGLASISAQISDALLLQEQSATTASAGKGSERSDGSTTTSVSGNGDGKNFGASLRRVARRQAPLDGGATQVYVPTARERGDFRLDTTMGCAGWRETAGCSPHGPRLSFKAAPCDYDVTSDKSGYCECTVGGGVKKKTGASSSISGDEENGGGVIVRAGHVGCGHLPFRCKDVCRRPPRRLCRGFVAMDSCTPLAPGESTGAKAAGRDFLSSKATTCHVTAHTAPLGSVPGCWAWQPFANQRCDAVLNAHVAGYCECGAALLKPDAPGGGGLWRVRVDCGHPPVSCAYLCNAEAEASPHGGDTTASSSSSSSSSSDGSSRGFSSSSSSSSDSTSSSRWQSGVLPPSAVGSYAVAGHGARHPLLAHLPHGVTAHEALGGGRGSISSTGSSSSTDSGTTERSVSSSASRSTDALIPDNGSSRSSSGRTTYSHTGLSLLPAAHVPWAWHTKAGVWHSPGSDWAVAPLLSAVASRHRFQKARIGTRSASSSEASADIEAGAGEAGGVGSNGAKRAVLGPISAYEAHVAKAVAHPPCLEVSRQGRYSGAIGCIGTRPKWTLALPLTPALQQAAALFTSPEALSVPWLVSRGVYSSAPRSRTTSTSSLLSSNQFDAGGEGQSSNALFDALSSCARLASVGDCSQVAHHCPVSCAALFLRLQPSPELCFPRQFNKHFRRTMPLLLSPSSSSSTSSPSKFSTNPTAPFRAAAAASTVLLADDALHAKLFRSRMSTSSRSYGSWNERHRRRKLVSSTKSDNIFGASTSRSTVLNASTREHLESVVDAGEDPVQDYLRGVKRASTMRVVLLALCLHPEATGNAPLSYHGASGWSQRLKLLKESVGRFKDYRILVQAHDQPPEGASGLTRACAEHRRVHCHQQTFHLSSSRRKRAASQPPVAAKASSQANSGGKGPRQRGYYHARHRRQLLGKKTDKGDNTVRYPYGARASKREHRNAKQKDKSKIGIGGSSHGDVIGLADASSTPTAAAHGGGGSSDGSAADAMFRAQAYANSVSEARLAGAELAYAKRSLLEMWRHAEGGVLLQWELVIMIDLGALGTPLPGVEAGTAALHGSGYHQVDVLGFDPNMIFRSMGRVAPLDGFDVLCGMSSQHLNAFNSDAATRSHDKSGKHGMSHESRFSTARTAAEFAFAQAFGISARRADGLDVNGKQLLLEEDSDGRPGYGMHTCATLPSLTLMHDDNVNDVNNEEGISEDNEISRQQLKLRPRPYPVKSCFSGIALYNPQALLACDFPEPDLTFLMAANPAIVGTVPDIEKDIPDLLNINKGQTGSGSSGSSSWNDDDSSAGGGSSGGHDRCDHESFHRCLRGSGFARSFVDPTLVAYAAPSSVSVLEAHRKVNPAVPPIDRLCVQLDDPSGATHPPSF